MRPREPVRSAEEATVDDLDPVVVAAARRTLEQLVERAGGVHGGSPIPVERLESLADLLQAWAVHHGRPAGNGNVRFDGNPGLWHALQGIYPISNPDRWDGLRQAVIARLENMGWERHSPPRGSVFTLPAERQRASASSLTDEQREKIRQRREEQKRNR